MERIEVENGENVREGIMSNRRTLRSAMMGVMKQASTSDTTSAINSAADQNAESVPQSEVPLEPTSESREAIQHRQEKI